MKQGFPIVGIAVAICLLGPVVTAQTVHDEIALSRTQIQSDRQTIVAATMGLSEEEGKIFWPLYRDYRAEMDKPLDRMWNVLTTYADNWSAMSDADATKALDEWLAAEKQQVEIRQKWSGTMRKTLPGVTVARFFQIDNKLDSVLRLEAAAEIPLVVKKK